MDLFIYLMCVKNLIVQYKGPAADANILGEMIFGAVAVNCKRVSLKIHIMEEPKRQVNNILILSLSTFY